MGAFLKSEKPRQAEFKINSIYSSTKTKADGFYKGHPYPFCLPSELADENLFNEIWTAMMAYFARNEIKWHDGHNGKPSNHMCDSQVCCANFLFPFFDKPDALAALIQPSIPELKCMLPIEDDQYVAFEWIGAENYLKEKISRNGKRTRGANFTSADAAIRFLRKDRKIQICLIEWKYTESYFPTSLKYAASGTDRTEIYKHLYIAEDCPLDKNQITSIDCLFYEPFYQLMRQQLLAHEMEKAHELEADIVSLLHIAPRQNKDFRRVTSPNLRNLGSSPIEVWKKLVNIPDKFQSVYTEDLFSKFKIDKFSELKNWWQYITKRYWWVIE